MVTWLDVKPIPQKYLIAYARTCIPSLHRTSFATRLVLNLPVVVLNERKDVNSTKPFIFEERKIVKKDSGASGVIIPREPVGVILYAVRFSIVIPAVDNTSADSKILAPIADSKMITAVERQRHQRFDRKSIRANGLRRIIGEHRDGCE